MEEIENKEIESSTIETTPEVSVEGQPTNVPSHVELDPAAKYKYGDLEFTADELKQSYLRQSDYTKKTQEIAKEREYHANLQYDLDAVKRNPQLASQFKQIYPKQYHNYLRYVGEQTQANETPSISPEIEQKLAKYDEFISRQEAAESQKKYESAEKEVNSAFDKYTPKYPLAHEAAVVSTVSNYLNQKKQKAVNAGQDPNQVSITDQEWESIFKSVHSEIEKLSLNHNKTKFERQRDASQRIKDVPSGGGIPGQKPRQPQTIKEAAKYAIEEWNEA